MHVINFEPKTNCWDNNSRSKIFFLISSKDFLQAYDIQQLSSQQNHEHNLGVE